MSTTLLSLAAAACTFGPGRSIPEAELYALLGEQGMADPVLVPTDRSLRVSEADVVDARRSIGQGYCAGRRHSLRLGLTADGYTAHAWRSEKVFSLAPCESSEPGAFQRYSDQIDDATLEVILSDLEAFLNGSLAQSSTVPVTYESDRLRQMSEALRETDRISVHKDGLFGEVPVSASFYDHHVSGPLTFLSVIFTYEGGKLLHVDVTEERIYIT